jgi:hypothetical protein
LDAGPDSDRTSVLSEPGSSVQPTQRIFPGAVVCLGGGRGRPPADVRGERRLLVDSGLYAFGRTVTYEMVNVYTLKMAGVFMITTCTLSLRTGIIPRWMAYLGLALALFLLLSLGTFYWAPLVFPLWVLLISVHILLANLGRSHG